VFDEGDSLRILILGGDGFCGWPTSLHLSASGHEVAIVDNLARRNADVELEAESLTPIKPLGTRLAAWRELTGREIPFHRLNVAEDYRELLDLLTEWQPEAVVHFAEQRAAPYSMKSSCWPRWWRPGSTRMSCTSGRWAFTATARPE
jgi:UDP-sulfoquinovose synthase